MAEAALDAVRRALRAFPEAARGEWARGAARDGLWRSCGRVVAPLGPFCHGLRRPASGSSAPRPSGRTPSWLRGAPDARVARSCAVLTVVVGFPAPATLQGGSLQSRGGSAWSLGTELVKSQKILEYTEVETKKVY
jgi:hypothetical protein